MSLDLERSLDQTTLQPVIGLAWPNSGQDTLIRLVEHYFERLQPSDTEQPIVLPFERLDALDGNTAQTAGSRYIVQSCDYVDSVVALFEDLVRKGVPDTPHSFRKIASDFYGAFIDFRKKWIDSTFVRDNSVLRLNRHDLFDAPEMALSLALRQFAPDLPINEIEISKAVHAVFHDNGAGQGLESERNEAIRNFRFYDPELFNTISRIKLRKADVLTCFHKLLDHPPLEENIIHLQRFASTELLADHLKQSKEYKKKFSNGQQTKAPATQSPAPEKPAAPPQQQPVLQDRPTVLVHLHIPKTAGTSLNGKLLEGHPVSTRMTALEGIPNTQLLNMSLEERAEVRVIAGHCVHGLHDLLPNPCKYICVLRKPRERIFSFFRFIHRNEDHPNNEWARTEAPTFGDFLRKLPNVRNLYSEIDNGQVRRIAGVMNIPDTDKPAFQRAVRHLLADNMTFGFTERFGDFLSDLTIQGHIVNSTEIFANVATEPSSFEAEIEQLSEDELASLNRYTIWDERLYEIAQIWSDT